MGGFDDVWSFRSRFMKNQLLRFVLGVVTGLALGTGAAADVKSAIDPAGFYGGVSLRDRSGEGDGISFGHLNSAWSKFTLPVTDDSAPRALAYGGYRWTNDLAVEAAVATSDRYALKPATPGARRGVGLALTGDNDAAARTWNVDVYTSWAFRKSFALYGRLGYAQSDVVPASYALGFTSDVLRRNRDGVNYGLGLRYDLSAALGLRLEYARFGRLPGDAVAGLLPENDQLQFGVQFRF